MSGGLLFDVESGGTDGVLKQLLVMVAVDDDLSVGQVDGNGGHTGNILNGFCNSSLAMRTVHAFYDVFFSHI